MVLYQVVLVIINQMLVKAKDVHVLGNQVNLKTNMDKSIPKGVVDLKEYLEDNVIKGLMTPKTAQEITDKFLGALHDTAHDMEDLAFHNTNKARWVGFGLGIIATIVVGFLVASIIYN
jgi:hypothetical protein